MAEQVQVCLIFEKWWSSLYHVWWNSVRPITLCWHFLETALVLCLLLIVILRHIVSYEGRRRKVARVDLTLFHFMGTKYEDLSIEIIARRIFKIYLLFCITGSKISKLFIAWVQKTFSRFAKAVMTIMPQVNRNETLSLLQEFFFQQPLRSPNVQ